MPRGPIPSQLMQLIYKCNDQIHCKLVFIHMSYVCIVQLIVSLVDPKFCRIYSQYPLLEQWPVPYTSSADNIVPLTADSLGHVSLHACGLIFIVNRDVPGTIYRSHIWGI